MHSGSKWLAVVVLAFCAASAHAQPAPTIDNDRVTVWDVTLTPSVSGPTTPRDKDTVIMFLEGGEIRTSDAHGNVQVTKHQFGDAVFVPRGTQAVNTLVSGNAAHAIMVVLKDVKVPAIINTTGLPAAFPRPGSVKMLDNDRVTVWHYSWANGVPTPMHFHDKDVIVAYRYDGALKSVTPDGASVINPYKKGEIRFNKGNRAHYEELATNRQSAVMMELK